MNSLADESAPTAPDANRGDAISALSDSIPIRKRLDKECPGLGCRSVGNKQPNLVSAVEQIFRPSIVTRAASVMGLDAVLLERAFRAGVPGVLCALSSVVSKRVGVSCSYDVICEQQLSALTSLGGLLERDKRAVAVVVKGLTDLTRLLGDSTMLELTRSLGRYAGLGITASRCVLGLLGAIVLGVLEQQRRAKGLGADELAQLIRSQDDHIAQALPTSFAEFLRYAGVLLANTEGGPTRCSSASGG